MSDKLPPGLRFNSWSASRLDDYERCPRFAAHKHLAKTCPTCFKGAINKGKWPNQVCSACGKARPTSDAMTRGGDIGATIESFIKGSGDLHEEIRNKKALALINKVKTAYEKGKAEVERTLNFDRNWKLLGEGWSPSIWLIVKMDAFRWLTATKGDVIDWKTGGIDKKTGQIRAEEKYDDQLLIYQIAGFHAHPKATEITAGLCFLDASGDPAVGRPTLKRERLEAAKKKIYKKTLAIMTDEVFAPRPNDKCRWCDFGKTKGGPCPF